MIARRKSIPGSRRRAAVRALVGVSGFLDRQRPDDLVAKPLLLLVKALAVRLGALAQQAEEHLGAVGGNAAVGAPSGERTGEQEGEVGHDATPCHIPVIGLLPLLVTGAPKIAGLAL